jgi:hypothetical protein
MWELELEEEEEEEDEEVLKEVPRAPSRQR